jgi:riboflavin biosynthesis pyrimidine reductase
MRTLVGDGSYAWPDGPWLRVNMVNTVDGAAQGPDGRSGTINNEVDMRVFQELRRTSDVILVGAGTARAERYGPVDTPIAVVGHTLPEALVGGDNVRLVGGDLGEVVASLRADGHEHVLCEGGPTLLAGLLDAGLVDELCVTITPHVIGGPAKRIVHGPALDVDVELVSLIEEDGTMLARWLVVRG